jgi:solute:Na+ symporter, SSS family
MNLNFLDFVVVGLYVISLFWIAVRTRGMTSFHEYSVAKRSLTGILIAASLSATYVGPGYCMGFTGKGFASGFTFLLFGGAFALQTILVGIFVAPRLNSFEECESLGDIFALKYGRHSQILAGIVSVGLCIGFSSIMAMVGGSLISSLLELPKGVSIAIITGISALYVLTGGLRASVLTDVLQFSVFAIAVPVLLIFSLIKSNAGFSDISAEAISLTLSGINELPSITIFGLLLAFFFGESLIPPYVNRALAASTQKHARYGFIWAGFFGLAWFVVVFFLGVIARFILPSSTPPDDVFLSLASITLPHGLLGLLITGVIGIVMSSQDSVINSGSVSLTKDVLLFLRDEKQRFIASRIGTIAIALVAGLVAFYLPSLIEAILICYTIWAPTVVIPLVVALFLPSNVRRPLAGVLGILFGGSAVIVWSFVLNEPGGIPSLIVGLVSCLIGIAIGMMVKKIEVIR